MNKRTIYTAFGVALSLLIASGGWFITDSMLDRKESDLLSVRGSVHVDAPRQTNTLPTDDEQSDTPDDKTDLTITNNFPKLSSSEIYRILEYWEADGSEQPHEPTEGQLSMEQTLNMAKEWLEYFCQRGLIPSEALDYDMTNAYLAKNALSQQRMNLINPLVNWDDIRDAKSLEPFYSYWTVYFDGKNMDTKLIINAGTGQIWKAEINSNTAAVTFDGIDAEDIRREFMAYIDAHDADGLLNTNAEVNPGTLEGKTVMARAVMSLSAILP